MSRKLLVIIYAIMAVCTYHLAWVGFQTSAPKPRVRRYVSQMQRPVVIDGTQCDDAVRQAFFDAADTNKDGLLQPDEAFKIGITGKVFAAFDLNGDGVIDKTEWHKVAKQHR